MIFMMLLDWGPKPPVGYLNAPPQRTAVDNLKTFDIAQFRLVTDADFGKQVVRAFAHWIDATHCANRSWVDFNQITNFY
jgi:hypothetical protein